MMITAVDIHTVYV